MPFSDDWIEVEVTVDSGACDTVMPLRSCAFKILPSYQSKLGLEYEVANGESIPNLGEKRMTMCTNETSTQRNLTMQVAEVNRALLSVAKMVDAGNRVVFDKDWSFIEDLRTGERSTIQRRGGLYILETWVKARRSEGAPPPAPFQRQGR